MSIGEISFGSLSILHVTWKVPAFLELTKESGYSLQSPEFPFADGRYCLRLFLTSLLKSNIVNIQLVNLTDTLPGTDVSYEVGLKSRTDKEIEIYHLDALPENFLQEFGLSQTELYEKRDLYLPDGTLIVFCYVRPREPSSTGSPKSSGAVYQFFSNFAVSSSDRVSSSFRINSGELSFGSPPFLHVTWKIPFFLKLAKKSGFSLKSPEFPFAHGRYCLRLFPFTNVFNGEDCGIELMNLTDTVPSTDVSYKVVLESGTGREMFGMVYGFGRILGQVYFSIAQLEFEWNMGFYIPDRTLTVHCFVRPRKPSSTGSQKSGGAEIQVFPDVKFSPPQVVTPSKSGGDENSDEDQEQELLPRIAKLQLDYRQLLQKGAESDACLVVSEKEFRAHRCVLRSRSPVFDAMFSHETAEKKSGRVVIKDLDPETFGDFLEFLYTGEVGAGISDHNAWGLYKAADKYEVPTLKSDCVAHMHRNLSVDTFCDVITLTLRHQEEELLQKAVRFFKENMARIIVTVKWQQFVIDNGTAANELFIKAIVPGEK